eukprot:TRINITY_DN940_c0_g1_i2.p1 TRINITY_DN940_c0_g1~~TRINITY_DN940_c0_g1_i2.p1  ORF type:complete len:544 (+),score=122.17 TRINITY_DN940_c0_g1_i2:197-1828(+)
MACFSSSFYSPKNLRVSADYVKTRKEQVRRESVKRESLIASEGVPVDVSSLSEEETLFQALPKPLQKFLALSSAEKRRSLWTGPQLQPITHERVMNTVSLKDIFQNYCGILPVFEEYCRKISVLENMNFIRETTHLSKLVERGMLPNDAIVAKQKVVILYSISPIRSNTILPETEEKREGREGRGDQSTYSSSKELYKKFIQSDSDSAVNLDYEEVDEITQNFNEVKVDLFSEAQKKILMLLESDCLRKFITDPLFESWKAEEVKRRAKANAKKQIPPWVAFTEAIKSDSSLAVLDALLEHGATVNDEDEFSAQTALHFACAKNTKAAFETVQYLLSYEADANAVDHQAWTPLHVACASGTFEIIRYLLDKGANPRFATKDGDLPVHLFAKGTILTSIDQMEDFAVLFDRLAAACKANDDETGANAKNYAGETALHFAVCNENKETRNEIMKVLLKKGCRVNAKSKRGTALHIAIIQNKPDIVELLLSNGADPQILCQSKRGQKTSQQLAVESCNDEIVKLISPYFPSSDNSQSPSSPATTST